MSETPLGPGSHLGTTRARMEKAPDVPSGVKGDLARLLRQGRVDRGMSQSELARAMSELGHQWHQTTVVKTERAEREPRHTELLALAQLLRIRPSVLLDPQVADDADQSLAVLEEQERWLSLRLDLQERDIARLKAERQETHERLRQVRRSIKAVRAEHQADPTAAG